jgi:hypothetical protein
LLNLADCPHCDLKDFQKVGIGAMLDAGFPPYAVSTWTGHSGATMMKHYSQDNFYLLPTPAEDYEEFGMLSEYGSLWMEKYQGSSKSSSKTEATGAYNGRQRAIEEMIQNPKE